ncbi:hypothetical protein B0H14DRAFT_3174088, partial [Mycena olivaceomarginata]
MGTFFLLEVSTISVAGPDMSAHQALSAYGSENSPVYGAVPLEHDGAAALATGPSIDVSGCNPMPVAGASHLCGGTLSWWATVLNRDSGGSSIRPQHPSPDPPPTDNAAQTATASKARGRSRGSKNKPKPPLTAASTSSAATTRPPKKKPRTGDPPGMPQAPEQPNPRSISSLARGLFRPRSCPSSPTSEPSAAASTSAQAGAAPSHQHDSTALSLRPPANAHILCVTVIAPYSPASSHNTASRKHRLHQRAVLHISCSS